MAAVPIILFMLVVVIALVASAAKKNRVSEAYSRLAKHYGGTFEGGGLFSRPKVHYKHGDVRVTIDIYSTGGEHPTYYTQAHFRGLLPTTRCELYPEGVWSRIGKLIGMKDILIGSPGFDDQYVIKGDNPAKISALLNSSVQQQIDQLRRFLGNDNIYVSFNSHKLLVKKLSYIDDYSKLLTFTRLAAKLYDLTVSLPDGAITIVSQTEPMDEEAICQVCGEPVTQQRVLCRRCKTPHHLDCWEYCGSCSTYGCQETRHTKARLKPLRR